MVCDSSLTTIPLLVDFQNMLFTGLLYKLFQQVVTSLEMTSGNKPDFNRVFAT